MRQDPPDHNADLSHAEELLRNLCDALGIRLGPGELRYVTPAQAALLDLFAQYPFSTLVNVEVQNGDPQVGGRLLEGAVAEKFRLAARAR